MGYKKYNKIFQYMKGRQSRQFKTEMKFKIKLSKEQFSGNMTPEQIQDIADEYKDYL